MCKSKRNLIHLFFLVVLLLANLYSYAADRRNIALHRAVYQSSALDFNATGQLVSDGILTVNKAIDADQNKRLDSRWISHTGTNEWIYIDLGTVSQVNGFVLHWDSEDYAARYQLQIANDARNWRTVLNVEQGGGGTESHAIQAVEARYVRLYCMSGSGKHFALIEMEVLGTNDFAYPSRPEPASLINGRQYLSGGDWRIQRASEVSGYDGTQLSTSGFDDRSWLPAKVPATVLMSYLEAGAIPDPNYGDQQLLISDSFFTADFWYRNTFTVPEAKKGERTWLNFDGINWKAEVFFNGTYLGRIDGAFIRGPFDITTLVHSGEANYLAVLVRKNDTPGEVTRQTKSNPGHNGGLLGADNPTIHASVGWDWLPTIRGRNIGIYQPVFIAYTKAVQLHNPWIVTDLDTEKQDFSKARLQVKTEIQNPTDQMQEVYVKGKILPSGLAFTSPVFSLGPHETKAFDLAQLTMEHPQLWWPNTYGDQFLYTAELMLYTANELSDSTHFAFGVREFSYDTKNPLTIYCNGVRIICRGGNWGMDDGNLAATEADYDLKLKLHAEANLTMIRNWVGMVRNDAFYRACDKYGILIWDDFWLANPGDGPNPDDEAMFMQNAVDKVKRNRYHAALALYCGRNEGEPPASLNQALETCTKVWDGTRHYIPHSAAGTVSGWGPYAVKDREWYFENTGKTIHSERGMPNIPAVESIKQMFPPEHQWPIDDVWGMHDFTAEGAQQGKVFLKKMEQYGQYHNLETFARIAQMVNYIGHKAIFEPVYTNKSNGMLLWMSQSAWPSLVWQTYDYYYDTNAGYFAVKQANQPINLIYNSLSQEFVLTNSTARDREELDVSIKLFDLDGSLLKTNRFAASAIADSRKTVSKLDLKDLSGIIFIQSTVYDRKSHLRAENFTWINADGSKDYTALSTIPETKLSGSYARMGKEKGVERYKIKIKNQDHHPALLIRLKAVNRLSGKRILPVFFEDNYFSLMPGESKEITLEIDDRYVGDQSVAFSMEGWNTPVSELR